MLTKHIDFKNTRNDKMNGTMSQKYNASESYTVRSHSVILFGTLWVSFDYMVILYISGYICPGLDPAISIL